MTGCFNTAHHFANQCSRDRSAIMPQFSNMRRAAANLPITAQRSAWLVIVCACMWQASAAQNSTSIREVGSADELQQALVDGVPHIVLTNHINADSITPVRGNLDAGIGAVKPTTKSIVVQLPSPSKF